MTEVAASILTGGITLLGVLIANNKAQAITETKLEELTREVREHNNFAKRMPVVEEQVETLTREINNLRHYHESK